RSLRYVEVHQSLSGAPTILNVTTGRLRRNRGEVFGGRGRYRRTIDLHQRLALYNVRSRRDVGDLQDEAFGPHCDDGDAALVELNRPGRADRRSDHAQHRRLGFHPGALDLSARQLDRTVVAVLVLIARDVI